MTPEQLRRLDRLAGGCTCPSAICYGDCLGFLAGLAVKELIELKYKVEFEQCSRSVSPA